jgi:hypothetical protein
MSLSGATKGKGNVAKTGAREQWLVLRLGKGPPPILPDHEPVVKTASTGGRATPQQNSTMSRLGTIDWPSFEDPILVTPVTDCPPIYGPANYIRLARSPRLSNVQTFYGR